MKRGAGALGPAVVFLLLILALRLFFFLQIHLPLTPDEAYYWDWGRHLAWGYYSKPPMVAWLMAASTAFLGISEHAVRFPALICGGLYLLFLYALGVRLGNQRVGLWGMLAAAVTPILAVYSFVMTIDPPLLAFWSLSLLLGWWAAESPSLGRFLGLGLSMGVGLLSKQTMVAFPVLYFLWLWWDKEKRPLLRTPGPYVAIVAALLMILPTLWWNAEHSWIMFKHTSHHFQEQSFRLTGPLEFLAEQAGVITPLIFALMLLGFYFVATQARLRRLSAVLYLFVFSAIPLALVLPLSFLRKVNANWPAPFYTSGFLLVALLGFGLRSPEKWKNLFRPLLLMGLLLGLLATMLVYALPVMPEKFPPKVATILYKFDGWRELAAEVQKRRRQGKLVIVDSRDYAAELAFYLPDHPETYTIWSGSYRSQYDIWDGLPQQVGQEVLIVSKGWLDKRALAPCLEGLNELGSWEKVLVGGRRHLYARFFQGRLKACGLLGPGL